MAMYIHWQSEASGSRSQERISLLGQGFQLTMLGDVIVDTSWMLVSDGLSQYSSELSEKIKCCLLNIDDNYFELNLLEQGTAYNRAVWNALTEIPLGQVMTYSELANKLNSGARAVAQACRNNPYPGIIPCHRVVSKSGIGGFMGQTQGFWIAFKEQLLSYERNIAQGRA